ncbi:Ligand-binding SRPBCC domain-containing protein [Bryocella elongata]|uniref:Ligand-binding SRPBCC domain-containing protein n=1 Tax=Bryocella elongata TaxID=863522 RepID=A0A1H6B1J1_9BACT|nr:SRPBCC family protein [Bryocella elongata]SEG54669.1 Ligand-binding SRPBCC domain-containing protein [Bryocella elongata]
MHLHFEAQQTVPFPVELVFAFFANPENLPRLMPPWQKARIEEAAFAPPPRPPAGITMPRLGIVAGNGTRLVITFRPVPLLPIRFPWEAMIEDFRWNQGFCDVQGQGPFAYWRHCHTVEPAEVNGKPGATITDRVEYALPLAPITHHFDALLVRPQLRSIFGYRQKRTTELLTLISRHQA